MSDFLLTPIEYLKGVGPARGKVLRSELGVENFGGLLYYFPFRYIDRTQFHQISDIPDLDHAVQLKGVITQIKEVGKGRGKRLEAGFRDHSATITLVWFKGIKWVKPKLEPGTELIVWGKARRYGARWSISHPELEFIQEQKQLQKGLQPVYHSGEKLQNVGFNTKGIERIVAELLPGIKGKIQEDLPPSIVQDLNLMDKETALIQIHQPKNHEQAQRAQLRLKFQELFILQLELLFRKEIAQRQIKGFRFETIGQPFQTFFDHYIPFELTNAQKRVIKEIRRDLSSGIHMNRLLQGDVGSGKTLVALMIMLIAVGNGYQTCLMAPTAILATQHLQSLEKMLAQMNVNVALLIGATKQKERKVIHEQLENGHIDILIGTHALLEEKVKYKNLGLAVIDEQHRFGVAQRSRLWKKNILPPHQLVMTATPIPRTLALTFYGDLDVSVIDELPPGRKPIQTSHRYESARLRVFQFLEDQIKLGRQAYIVYPLIEESEKLDYQNLMSGYEAITKRFPRPDYRVSIVHGQMNPEDKDYEMEQFAAGKTQIMVATTVIEVGVNVPNASMMIIESAEKFGLSQLHQLRGRVGRGASQSYCILMSGNKLGENAKKRLETMCDTNDGFKIAEVDLRLRGPGDIMGTQQSGLLNLKLSDLSKDAQIVGLARQKALELLEKDPKLEAPEHQRLANRMRQILKSRPNWSRIS
jgi:ATP-dependent DNA helicase RecG